MIIKYKNAKNTILEMVKSQMFNKKKRRRKNKHSEYNESIFGIVKNEQKNKHSKLPEMIIQPQNATVFMKKMHKLL